MSATWDATASTSGLTVSSLSWSHTCTGSSLVLIVDVLSGNGSTSASSVTYGGTAMTSIGKVFANNGSTGFIERYRLLGPSAGAATVQVTFGATQDVLVGASVSFAGASQTSGDYSGTTVTAFGDSATSSVATTTPPASTSQVIAATCCGSPVLTSAQTQRWLISASSSFSAGCGAGETTTGTGSNVTMSFGVTSDFWGIIATEVRTATQTAVSAAPLAFPAPGLTPFGRPQPWAGTSRDNATTIALSDPLVDGTRTGTPTDTIAVGVGLADTAGAARTSTTSDTPVIGVVLTDTIDATRAGTTTDTLAVGVVIPDHGDGASRAAGSVGDLTDIGVALADQTTTGAVTGATTDVVAVGVVLTDTAGAVRASTAADALTVGVALLDAAGVILAGVLVDTITTGVVLADPDTGGARSGDTAGETADNSAILVDPATVAVRAEAQPDTITFGLLHSDTPGTVRTGGTTDALTVSIVLIDTVSGARMGVTLGDTTTLSLTLTDPAVTAARASGTVDTLTLTEPSAVTYTFTPAPSRWSVTPAAGRWTVNATPSRWVIEEA